MTHISAKVDEIGSVRKTVIAWGNTELSDVSQKIDGYVQKGDAIIEFGSDSKTQAMTKEDAVSAITYFLRFL